MVFNQFKIHAWLYEALAEQLADYLLESAGSKWEAETEKGILFLDKTKSKRIMNATAKLRCIISDNSVLKLSLYMFMNADQNV